MELSELSKKYPYSQLLPILYLNGLKSNNSIEFEDELTKYSYKISDRAQLYQLMHSHSPKETKEESVIDSATSSSDVEQKNVVIDISNDENFEVLDTDVGEEGKFDEEIKESATEELPTEEDKQIVFEIPEDPLEQNILSHVVFFKLYTR